ncbi:GntP family permease [Bacillus sp. HMF5848]|uniref:GntP family permease n=1 Tax=Bacillus sp. HMF5848 TaxID=2495421 RepID=UPI000F7A6FF7|nr:SLC13 family permease [Bacillus sp. HMF5848]RSK26220.1 GntP family permease [Bacillus sp. HMF5848]
MEISIFGTLCALLLIIFLIIKGVTPPYAMMIGAFIGSIIGGLSVEHAVTIMIEGAQGMTGVVLRVLTAGVLAGVLIESGAAKIIAETILQSLGEKKALLAIAVATMLLTAVGVFIAVAVLTVAPIALAIASRANMSKLAVLLAISGGGKAGNIISPNPNTIAISESFDLALTSVMVANVIPAFIGLGITYVLSNMCISKGTLIKTRDLEEKMKTTVENPTFLLAIIAPMVAILLLLLQPIFNVSIDPLIALPVGGVIGAIAMGRTRDLLSFVSAGLDKMGGVAILLIGTGTLTGVITHSALLEKISVGIEALGLPSFSIAPIAGITMSAATASTAAASAAAGAAFAPAILKLGIAPLAAGAMVHAGTVVLDHLPHGTYFHITRNAVHMDMKERFRLLPYETLIGIVIVTVSVLMFGILG